MIRIDEIYNHTFWPWVEKHHPGVRMFFCDPPGDSTPDALRNFGSDDIQEQRYIFFHDQEPIHLDIHQPLFDEVVCRVTDIAHRLNDTNFQYGNEFHWVQNITTPSGVAYLDLYKQEKISRPPGAIVVSEHGDYVNQICTIYGWQKLYYFFHGWACLDWYRGYDKTFLIPRARDRSPTRTFMSPNRIVGGKRDHRVLFLYNLFKHQLDHNYISAPRHCVYENVDIAEVAKKYVNTYPDIEQVFLQANLPRLFAGEDTQQMTSCWLTNFAEAQDSLVYVPTETLYFGRRLHITEKTFKAIALEMPWVLIAPAGSLEYMRGYGFQTFGSVFDESYDQETDDIRRIERVTALLKDLDSVSERERQQIHRACLPIVEHNFNHFYHGGFAEILWKELQGMLNEIKSGS